MRLEADGVHGVHLGQWTSQNGDHSQELEVVIGVLALQGAFAEHQDILQRLFVSSHFRSATSTAAHGQPLKFTSITVRTVEELERCSALIIPGGESTTIALLLRLSNLLEPLQEFTLHKPIWGTCAGAILLSTEVANPKKGGQEVLKRIGVRIERNGWGSQVESFEAHMDVPMLRNPQRPFLGVFIRAPVVVSLLDAISFNLKAPQPLNHSSTISPPPIEIVARLPEHLLPSQTCDSEDDHNAQSVVALRQGRHFLTTFHPELTDDDRFHDFFVRRCVLPSVLAQDHS
ncbi:hypothetical protein HGRIS_009047 [Hohenbuehelia grisea]|uniref:glutaminase n=1 Tax=Hohenbuehelia grisea TaxID=104357 RepID=A0ABR3J039_9AGAR